MCFDIVEVALLVCAGPNSVAGPFTADRFDGSSAAGGGRRQQAAHHKRLRSFPRGTPKLGSVARAGARVRWTCAQRWCTRGCVIGVVDTQRSCFRIPWRPPARQISDSFEQHFATHRSVRLGP